MPPTGLLRKLPGRTNCHQSRKTSQMLAARKEDRIDRKTEPSLAGPCGELGTQNACCRRANNHAGQTLPPVGFADRTWRECLELASELAHILSSRRTTKEP